MRQQTAVIADDLTGANDTAVQFARQGWDTRLVLTDLRSAAPAPAGDTPSATRALATTTDARALPDPQAQAVTSDTVTAALSAGAERFYLKIDSTIRGSVSAQITGALAALESNGTDALAVVCPAYPGMGRQLQDSTLLVNGAPVAETALRNDPATPVEHSDLRQIIPGAQALQPADRSAEALARALVAAYEANLRILVVDAVEDADLRSLAQALADVDFPTLPVGSAGLAAALAETWPHHQLTETAAARAGTGSRLLLQVSSLNPVSVEQAAQLNSHEGLATTFIEPPAQVLTTAEAALAWLQEAELPTEGALILKSPEERTDDARAVATALGAISAALLNTGEFAAAGLIGGDGALAALRASGCTSLQVLDALEEGMPLAATVDGQNPGQLIFTKAGGFGSPASLIHAVESMHHVLNRSTA